MLSVDRINKEMEKEGLPLELIGSRGSYCLTTSLGEGTLFGLLEMERRPYRTGRLWS